MLCRRTFPLLVSMTKEVFVELEKVVMRLITKPGEYDLQGFHCLCAPLNVIVIVIVIVLILTFRTRHSVQLLGDNLSAGELRLSFLESAQIVVHPKFLGQVIPAPECYYQVHDHLVMQVCRDAKIGQFHVVADGA